MRFLVDEEMWFEEAGNKVLGMLGFDLTDGDYVIYILGRDARNRYRAVWVDQSIATRDEAYHRLELSMAKHASMEAEEFYQGDEVGPPLDFFTPIVPAEKLNENFNRLISFRGWSPARQVIGEMMHYFQDVDGNFVEQFQTGGFDARIWELYLYALFTELGYKFDRPKPAPDFACVGPFGKFFVEATTVNPSGNTVPPEQTQEYFEHYVPLKYGSALFSKLNKKYWELPDVSGHPLVFAIQDFHAPQSMFWSHSALVEYLYGIRQTEKMNPDGTARTESEPIEFYLKGDRRIPGSFFTQPLTENVSAVIATPAGTLVKFNRMGFLARFGDRDLLIARTGKAYQGSVNPEVFSADLRSSEYTETWVEGLNVYHNPNALHPLDLREFPGAAHHISRDGRIMSRMPPFHPIGSITSLIVPTEEPNDSSETVALRSDNEGA